MLAELAEKIIAIPDEKGRPIGTKVYKPNLLYKEMNNVPPDLLIYFGNLSWRSVGTIGGGEIHTFSNDTGPDDANHAQDGVFILYDPKNQNGGKELSTRQIYDIAPTILKTLDVEIPNEMIGKAIELE